MSSEMCGFRSRQAAGDVICTRELGHDGPHVGQVETESAKVVRVEIPGTGKPHSVVEPELGRNVEPCKHALIRPDGRYDCSLPAGHKGDHLFGPRRPTEDEGLKFDQNKLPWHLLPWRATQEIVKVLAFGAKKYGPNNWQLVDHYEDRYFAAMIRHLITWYALDERNDEETGFHHLTHAGCCLLFLLHKELTKESPHEDRDNLPYP